FKIDDESIYETRSNIDDSISHQDTHETFTNGSIAEIKQIVDMLDNIDQSSFNKEYRITFYEIYFAIKHCQVNNLTDVEVVGEVFKKVYKNYIVLDSKDVPKFDFLEFQPKFSKHNPYKHSKIFYKLEGKYHILIKPNIKVSASYVSKNSCQYSLSSLRDEPLRAGGNKIVKTSGIEIILSEDKKLKNIKQVVTAKSFPNEREDYMEVMSLTDDGNERTKSLFAGDVHERQTKSLTDSGYIDPVKSFVDAGYRLVFYKHATKNMQGYPAVLVQDYLGENLWVLLKSNKFTPEQRLKIIELHWNQVSINMRKYNDTKLDNVVLKRNNKTGFGYELNIIDYAGRAFRYMPNKTLYETFSGKSRREKLHIFQFINMYYQIWENYTEDVANTTYSNDGSVRTLKLSRNNPFAELLQKAYLCELEWKDCKKEVNKILYPHQYVGPVGGIESSAVVDTPRVYV
ncbi:MAG: hypothetical protein QG673_1818, partial [Pseudomonadota bacterium]|nr:hypothetical protein [Pseudomonadota bacterium]